ncbi:hypothetical protein [Nocardiopsis lucentensis]|nr:hypothetical protein [Nocardiopsis lucentensis]
MRTAGGRLGGDRGVRACSAPFMVLDDGVVAVDGESGEVVWEREWEDPVT